jgi:hypothetical protein
MGSGLEGARCISKGISFSFLLFFEPYLLYFPTIKKELG